MLRREKEGKREIYFDVFTGDSDEMESDLANAFDDEDL